MKDLTENQKYVLCDPQTSGGLLIAVAPEGVEEVSDHMKKINHPFYEIGELTPQTNSKKIISFHLKS